MPSRSPLRGVARLALLLSTASLALACKDPPSELGSTNTRGSEQLPKGPSERCIVHLHGKSGRGRAPEVRGALTHLYPNGNAKGWKALQWLYFPDEKYVEVRRVVADTLDAGACRRAIVHGFSNGAAAAAKLRCKDERFDGRVIGYIVDDPVPDHGVDGCARSPELKVTLYWSGALAQAAPGWKCAAADWTCQGAETIGIENYAQALGVPVTASVHEQHAKYDAPPEYSTWW